MPEPSHCSSSFNCRVSTSLDKLELTDRSDSSSSSAALSPELCCLLLYGGLLFILPYSRVLLLSEQRLQLGVSILNSLISLSQILDKQLEFSTLLAP